VKRTALLFTLIALLTVTVGVIGAQTPIGLPAFSGVINHDVTIAGGDVLRNISNRPDPNVGFLSDLRWSSDGAYLLYVYNDGITRSLMLARADGREAVAVAENVGLLPPTFTRGVNSVLYTVERSFDQIDAQNRLPVDVFQQLFDPETLLPTGQTTQIGTIPFGVGCGGGSPFPMDAVYNEEAGFGGSALRLEDTLYGILYSTDCSGVGLGLLNPSTGETAPLADDLGRAVVNANGSRLAGIAFSTETMQSVEIRVIDLLTRDVSASYAPLEGELTLPDQLAWGADDSIYYSTRQMFGDPLFLNDAQRAALQSATAQDNAPQFDTRIIRIAPDGAQTQLYASVSWGIPRLFPTTDRVYFTQIPDGVAWLDAITAGELDPFSLEGMLTTRDLLAPALYSVPLTGGEATEVFSRVYQAALRPFVMPS
jgi:hypothetical protein